MMEASQQQHQPLILKYRPQKLADLVGQAAVSCTLTNAIIYERLCHAYLFTGPRGTGKTSTARILAKSLNCQAQQKAAVDPCQICSSCLEITRGTSPAVFEIDAASNNSVDDARILIERAPFVSLGNRYKIYIIDECHMLTKEAFNALLKTIEHPPVGVVFVLATTEEHKVPVTIISRCQRLMFHLIKQDELVEHLKAVAIKENISIEDGALELIARCSGGGVRDALGLLDQTALLDTNPGQSLRIQDVLVLLGSMQEDILLELGSQILNRNGEGVLSLLHNLLADGREPVLIVQELSRHMLNLMKAAYLAKSDNRSSKLLGSLISGSSQYMARIVEQGELLDCSELSQMVEELAKLELVLKRTTQPAMHLEIGLLSLCHRHNMLLINDLERRIVKLEAGNFVQTLAAQASPIFVDKQDVPLTKKSEEPKLPENLEPNFEPKDQQQGGLPTSGYEDLGLFWGQVLDELQRTHLPTYSLASMHAFPLKLTENELTVGVMVETFQKMLTQKLDHLSRACQNLTEQPFIVTVKVSPPPSPKDNTLALSSNLNAQEIANTSIADLSFANEQISTREASPGEIRSEQAIVKEAYKLFEGPGSRLIS